MRLAAYVRLATLTPFFISLLACSGSPDRKLADTPTSPAPVAPTAVSVSVTGSAPPVGGSSSFAAAATLSDGTVRNVTNEANWKSSNTSVVTVNGDGTVSASAAGEADISATYQEKTGVTHLAIKPAKRTTFTLGGTIIDGLSLGVLPNVGVRIVDGANAGKSATTNGAGDYSIADVAPGSMTVIAGPTSYHPEATRGVVVADDTRLDIYMARMPPPSRPAYTITTCGASGVVDTGASTLSNIFATVSPPPPVGTALHYDSTISNPPQTISHPWVGLTDASGRATGWPAWGVTGGLPVGAIITLHFTFVDQATFGASGCDKQFTVIP